jgi:hypothetical protein
MKLQQLQDVLLAEKLYHKMKISYSIFRKGFITLVAAALVLNSLRKQPLCTA